MSSKGRIHPSELNLDAVTREACLLADGNKLQNYKPLMLWTRCLKMPKARVTECLSRDSGSSSEEREREQARHEVALVRCRDPRAGYPEILLINVSLATEVEHS